MFDYVSSLFSVFQWQRPSSWMFMFNGTRETAASPAPQNPDGWWPQRPHALIHTLRRPPLFPFTSLPLPAHIYKYINMLTFNFLNLSKTCSIVWYLLHCLPETTQCVWYSMFTLGNMKSSVGHKWTIVWCTFVIKSVNYRYSPVKF